MKKYQAGGSVPALTPEQIDKNRRMIAKAEREHDRIPEAGHRAGVEEFDRRVADGEDYSFKTLGEANFSAKAPYRIKNMRDDARKSTSDILRRPVGMKKGGSVSSASKRADGCATKGKTKGMMVKMKSGGMCK
jgi:hypothetical protein